MDNLKSIMDGLFLISVHQAQTLKVLKRMLKQTEKQIALEKKRQAAKSNKPATVKAAAKPRRKAA